MTTEPPPPSSKPGILVVDDTPANLELLCSMLQEQGHESRPVLSGRAALAAARADPPDLILLDVRMTDMNGFEVCECLKADARLREIPVIFITALTDTADKMKGFALGAVDYVTKPFQGQEVAARVRTHLRIRSLQRELSEQNEKLESLVVHRTHELAEAHQRLLQLGRLKDDFLRMLAHEIRTPVNGVLGIGELLIKQIPASEESMSYVDHFHLSSRRLRSLIDDTTALGDMGRLVAGKCPTTNLACLLAEIRASLPDVEITIVCPAHLQAVAVKGTPALLQRALITVVQIAAAFSRNRQNVSLAVMEEAQSLRVSLTCDALSLSSEVTAQIFDIESRVRASSPVEGLGLAPVVAHKIFAAFGGELRLIKQEGCRGGVEVVLSRVASHE